MDMGQISQYMGLVLKETFSPKRYILEIGVRIPFWIRFGSIWVWVFEIIDFNSIRRFLNFGSDLFGFGFGSGSNTHFNVFLKMHYIHYFFKKSSTK